MTGSTRRHGSACPWIAGRAFAALALLVLFWSSAMPASATTIDIKQVTSPGGIKAWLVQSDYAPLIAMRFAFRGGAAHDPEGKEGLAYFVSGMLDEGAGDLESVAFQERAEELAVKMEFDVGRDMFTGSLQTLTRNREEAFDLLRMALTEPRFDEGAVERVRKQILTGLKLDLNDPRKVASREWFKLAFQGHPYAQPLKGTPESVNAISAEDLKGFVRRGFTRDSLEVAVVGDIDPETLGKALDEIFGGLPVESGMEPIPEAEPPMGPRREVIEMDVPQSVVQFGHRGIKRKDEDFIPAYVLNYILGGGGFASRLTEEVREKRGLAYSVYSHLSPYQSAAVYVGAVATENKSVGRSLEVIRSELERMAEEGPTAEELKYAEQYLIGSYPLRFDSNAKIAEQLLWIQIEDLGIDYVDTRNDKVRAVTLEEVRRVARRLLHADGLIVTIVGNPEQAEERAPKG